MFDSYSNFITKNISQITAIENTIKSVTYLIPTKESVFASEAVYAALNILGMIHDKILLNDEKFSSICDDPRNFYSSELIKTYKGYSKLATLLTIINHVQVPGELFLIKKKRDTINLVPIMCLINYEK